MNPNSQTNRRAGPPAWAVLMAAGQAVTLALVLDARSPAVPQAAAVPPASLDPDDPADPRGRTFDRDDLLDRDPRGPAVGGVPFNAAAQRLEQSVLLRRNVEILERIDRRLASLDELLRGGALRVRSDPPQHPAANP